MSKSKQPQVIIHSQPKDLNPHYLQIIAIILDMVATLTLTTHVLFIHQKFSTDIDGVIVSGNEATERIFIVLAIILYSLSFILFFWSQHLNNKIGNKRFRRIEEQLNINLST